MACSTTRYTVPSAFTLQPPKLEYPALRGRSVQIVVLDHRGDRQDSDALVKAVHDSIAQALIGAGVPNVKASDTKLEARITAYRADFEFAAWNGCVRLIATLDAPPRPRAEVAVERCVKRSNLWGYRSGDEAVQQAYSDALSELLSRIDQLR